MAGADRTATHSLGQALQREPYRFDFFQALRRLECLYRDKPRLGQSVHLADDPVRLAQEPAVTFAPRTLASFAPSKGGGTFKLAVFFFGLFGPQGPLPLHLTEYARSRWRAHRDPTFIGFADVFHHRMLALFYRAWANAQPTVNFDRPESDRFATYIGAMFGLGMPSLRHRDAVPDLAKLHYAGQLVCQTGHAAGLQAILKDFFQLPVRIEQFIGHWMELPESCRTRLGESPETGALGLTASIGARTWDCQHKFRIIIGPMGLVDYRRLLPGGQSLERLVTMVRNYMDDSLIWDLNLILKKEEVPPLEMGADVQLGWTTWSASEPLEEDADDLFLNPYISHPATTGV